VNELDPLAALFPILRQRKRLLFPYHLQQIIWVQNLELRDVISVGSGCAPEEYGSLCASRENRSDAECGEEESFVHEVSMERSCPAVNWRDEETRVHFHNMELSTFALIIGILCLVFYAPLLVNGRAASQWMLGFMRNDVAVRSMGAVGIVITVLILRENYAVGTDIAGLLRLVAWIGLIKGVVAAWWPQVLLIKCEKFLASDGSRLWDFDPLWINPGLSSP